MSDMDVTDKAARRERKQERGLAKAKAQTLEAIVSRVDQSMISVEQSLKSLRSNEKSIERELGKLVARAARITSALDPSVDERFIDVAQPLVNQRRTMLGYDRLHTLWQAAANAAVLPLPAVEIGTFRGGSAALLAGAFRALTGTDRELHVVDTFEGHLDETFSEHDAEERQRGKFQGTTLADVRQFLSTYAKVHVHQGDAAAVLAAWPERHYALVHIDVDLYQPMRECLDYFGPRMAPAGIIVVDDYESPTCPGVAQAVSEFLTAGAGFQKWRMQAEQAVLIKR